MKLSPGRIWAMEAIEAEEEHQAPPGLLLTARLGLCRHLLFHLLGQRCAMPPGSGQTLHLKGKLESGWLSRQLQPPPPKTLW